MPEDTGVAQLLAERRAAREAEVAARAAAPPKSAKDYFASGLTPNDMNRLQLSNQKPLSAEEFNSRPNQITEDDIAIAQAPREYSLDNASQRYKDMVHNSRMAVQDYAKRLVAAPVDTVTQTAVDAATGVHDTLTYPGRLLQGDIPYVIDPVTGRVAPEGQNQFVVNALGMMGGGGATRRLLGGGADGIELGAMGTSRYVRSDGRYSRAAEAALELPQETGTVQQMVNMLRKQEGVTEAELKNSGILQMAEASGADKITRKELASKIENSFPEIEAKVYTPASLFNRARYGQYTVPEGENYREVTLNLATSPDVVKRIEELNPLIDEAYLAVDNAEFNRRLLQSKEFSRENTVQLARVDSERIAALDSLNKLLAESNELNSPYNKFGGGHHGDLNTLAHLRMSDRVGPNGEKVLHVEEIQSDWGQQGRDSGFRQRSGAEIDNEIDAVEKNWSTLNDTQRDNTLNEYTAKLEALVEERNLPPPGPYVGNTSAWTDLALKHVLKTAADGEYNKIIYTPGAEHVGRFGLRESAEGINYFPDENRLEVRLSKYNIMEKGGVKPEDLPKYIGKELSQKLLKDENAVYFSTGNKGPAYHSLEGDGLEIGGEGMKDYYDSIVPKRLQALAKQYDKNAKVGYTDVALPFKYAKESTAPGLTITPEMRASILKGQRAYAHGGIVTL